MIDFEILDFEILDCCTPHGFATELCLLVCWYNVFVGMLVQCVCWYVGTMCLLVCWINKGSQTPRSAAVRCVFAFLRFSNAKSYHDVLLKMAIS